MPSFLEEYKSDQNFRNIIRLSIGFGFIYFGLKTSQSYTVPLLGSLGSVSLSIAYFGYAFANLFVPSMVSMFKNERFAMACAAMEYPMYTFVFVYIIPWLCIVWSCIHGFASSVFWACQGVYLAMNSTDENRGRRAGIFWSIYMSGAVLGNLCVFILFKVLKTNPDTGHNGWNGSTSILFILLGTVSIFGSIVLFGLKPAAEDREKVTLHRKQNIVAEVMSVLRMIVNHRMILLVPLFSCLGFQSIFVNSMYNRQIVDTANVSLYMIVYTVVEMFAGFIHGWGIDLLGLYPMLILYILLGSGALILCYFANSWQNHVFIPLYILFSLTDSGFQTFCLTAIGHHFKEERTVANAVFRMFQALGGGICYITGRFFVYE
ncbi:hypothetical protein WA171_002095, partial [Blastocystis sp. BT1]